MDGILTPIHKQLSIDQSSGQWLTLINNYKCPIFNGAREGMSSMFYVSATFVNPLRKPLARLLSLEIEIAGEEPGQVVQ